MPRWSPFPGIGARKLEQYGADVLAMVKAAIVGKNHAQIAGQNHFVSSRCYA